MKGGDRLKSAAVFRTGFPKVQAELALSNENK